MVNDIEDGKGVFYNKKMNSKTCNMKFKNLVLSHDQKYIKEVPFVKIPELIEYSCLNLKQSCCSDF